MYNGENTNLFLKIPAHSLQINASGDANGTKDARVSNAGKLQ